MVGGDSVAASNAPDETPSQSLHGDDVMSDEYADEVYARVSVCAGAGAGMRMRASVWRVKVWVWLMWGLRRGCGCLGVWVCRFDVGL